MKLNMNRHRLLPFLFILALTLSLFSCKEKPTPEPTITVKYLALGDSYTIGQGVEENERWPNQLSSRATVKRYRGTKNRNYRSNGMENQRFTQRHCRLLTGGLQPGFATYWSQ